jgi:hypothetical protein
MELRETKPVLTQRVLIEAANSELRQSQQRFFREYADMPSTVSKREPVGGAKPENN